MRLPLSHEVTYVKRQHTLPLTDSAITAVTGRTSDLRYSFILPFIISLSLSSSACLSWLIPCSYNTSDWIRQMSLCMYVLYIYTYTVYTAMKNPGVPGLVNYVAIPMYQKALRTGYFPHFRSSCVEFFPNAGNSSWQKAGSCTPHHTRVACFVNCCTVATVFMVKKQNWNST